MTYRIAIVEDEPAIAANYQDAFIAHGYEADVYPSRALAMQAFTRQLPDLAVIDIGLGAETEGGFDLCRDLRALAPRLPIIFLSARDSDLDVVSGLRLGADEYLTKDISLAQLTARVTALFRRVEAFAQPQREDRMITRGRLQLDPDRLTARWIDEPVTLTLTEFRMLESLARHPGHVKNRDQLMAAADTVLDDSTITSHIKRIRRKFEDLDSQFGAIQTVYGAGYRWDPDRS